MNHLYSSGMRRIVVILLTFCIVPELTAEPLAPEPAQFPQQMSASKLLNACASSSLTAIGRERRKYCAGFVSGVEEAVRILQEQHRLEASVCLPEDVTARALSDVFIRYGSKRKQHMDKPAAIVVLESLSDAWPCQQAE